MPATGLPTTPPKKIIPNYSENLLSLPQNGKSICTYTLKYTCVCHGLAHGHATPNVPTASELGHQAGSGLVGEIPQAGPDMRCYEPRFLKLGDHHKVKTQFNLLIYQGSL